MKKLKFLVVALVVVAAIALIFTFRIVEDKTVTFNSLPENSKTFIATHFAGQKVFTVREDREIFDRSWEVFFESRDKIEFDRKGEWRDIEIKSTSVPEAIIPAQIREYLAKSHPGTEVVEIARGRRSYDIELRGGLEIEFNHRFEVTEFGD